MNMLNIFHAFKDFGPSVAFMLALLFIVYYVVKASVDRLKSHEAFMQDFVNTHVQKNNDVSAGMLQELKLMQSSTKDAHDFQRTEHKQMIENLIKLNGNTS